MNDRLDPTTTRRNFLKGAALTTGALTLPTLSSVAQGRSAEDVPRRSDEKALYLGFFDPAEGHVPNPGMGVSGRRS